MKVVLKAMPCKGALSGEWSFWREVNPKLAKKINLFCAKIKDTPCTITIQTIKKPKRQK